MIRHFWQAGRFLAAGGLNTVVTYLVYLALTHVIGYQIAYAIAYACGIVLSYWLNLRFVFKAEGNWRKFIRYPIVYAVQYGLSAVLLHVLVRDAGWRPALAPLVSIAATLPVTFVLSRWLLGDRTDRAPLRTACMDVEKTHEETRR